MFPPLPQTARPQALLLRKPGSLTTLNKTCTSALKNKFSAIEKRMKKNGCESIRFGSPSTAAAASTSENVQNPRKGVRSVVYLTSRSKKLWRLNITKHPPKQFTSCASREPSIPSDTSSEILELASFCCAACKVSRLKPVSWQLVLT